MKRALRKDQFNLTMWQHDGAKPHQANVVAGWLNNILVDRMKAIRSRRGDN